MATFHRRGAASALDAPLEATAIQARPGAQAGAPVAPARLLVVGGPRAGVVIALEKRELTVGRGWDNDLVLPDISVSRRHALLRREGREYLLLDRGSGNGTGVNGRATAWARLRDGDEISFGDSVVQFVEAGSVPIRCNAAAVREQRRIGRTRRGAGSRAAACAGVAALLLGTTALGLRAGQAPQGDPLEQGAPSQPIERGSDDEVNRPEPPGEPGPASEAANRTEGTASGAVTPLAPRVEPSRIRTLPVRRGRGGLVAQPPIVAAPGDPPALGRSAEDEHEREDLARIADRAREAYLRGYVAKDVDPDAARRAFRLVLASLPPDDETASKARRWLDRLEGKASGEEGPAP
jgi:predicted component of type VI protein secretion system